MSIEYQDQLIPSGTFDAAATPAATTIVLGFSPSYVKVQNVTTILMQEHYDGMADASALLTTGSTGVVTIPTTNGITLTATGFTVGTGVQGSASDTMYWEAHR